MEQRKLSSRNFYANERKKCKSGAWPPLLLPVLVNRDKTERRGRRGGGSEGGPGEGDSKQPSFREGIDACRITRRVHRQTCISCGFSLPHGARLPPSSFSSSATTNFSFTKFLFRTERHVRFTRFDAFSSRHDRPDRSRKYIAIHRSSLNYNERRQEIPISGSSRASGGSDKETGTR